MGTIIKEACVETLEEAIQAESKGADRLELCEHLDVDGLTPGKALILQVINKVNIPVKVMIRPRAGDFVYTEDELVKMIESIRFCKSLNVSGVVYGITNKENHLAIETIEKLATEANPMEVTIHKAIDQCHDPVSEISQLLKIKNVTSVLTSGMAKTAIEGHTVIKEMMKTAGNRIKIIAAGKITKDNLSRVCELIGAHEYHGRRIV